jgi:NADH dehydrogenase FAD-containing subunit
MRRPAVRLTIEARLQELRLLSGLPDAASMRSPADPGIFIVGDACIHGDMPKSAFAANSQAKVAAMVVRGELANGRHLRLGLKQHRRSAWQQSTRRGPSRRP